VCVDRFRSGKDRAFPLADASFSVFFMVFEQNFPTRRPSKDGKSSEGRSNINLKLSASGA
jgi:hypothetical protein